MKTLKILFLLISSISFAQVNYIQMDVVLDSEENALKIDQYITFHNRSNKVLDSIYLHNWPNSFRNRKTALAKRMLEDYKKNLHFAKTKDRGFTNIETLKIDEHLVNYNDDDFNSDILKIALNKTLKPKDSIDIHLQYTVKIPKDEYTRYGRNNDTYNLRYWYIVPAIFDGSWHKMSNLNMDDLWMDKSHYDIFFSIPSEFNLSSPLTQTLSESNNTKNYHLKGKDRVDIDLHISKSERTETLKTSKIEVVTNLTTDKLTIPLKEDLVNRELQFIENYLGEFPHEKIFVNKISYTKNPVYGLSQLPSFLAPFSHNFEFDIKMFKVLSREYIDNTLLVNRRTDAWIADALQNFLMMKYVQTYYPDMKNLGKLAKIWGVRSFTLATMDYNDKYPFVYQISARGNIDQPLTIRADSLSNFNRKIVNTYKAGLGLKYLDEYLQDSIINQTIKSYYNNNKLKITNAKHFNDILKSNTTKDIDWFFKDYLTTSKKIDYSIKKIERLTDSVKVTIKNKRDFVAPITISGVKNDEVKFKKWLHVDSTQTFTFAKNDYNRLALNYDYASPEINLRDNWKNVKPKLLNRPLQIRPLRDAENPYYNQLFVTPEFKYNIYDGFVLGLALSNKTILRKNFTYKITPSYSTKSKDLTGKFGLQYRNFVENANVHSYQIGLAGSYFHYKEDLAYRTLSPWVNIYFQRKSLRDVGGSVLNFSYQNINRDPDLTQPPTPDEDKYSIFSATYGYSKPEIIQDFRYFTQVQVANKFSKANFDIRYRKLTSSDRQLDFRLFGGIFLNNKTTSTFFDYALVRPNDYLFEQNYLGQSESSGFFSQQITVADGNFKSNLPTNYANQWMTSLNTSVSIWRWIEAYGDVALVKNRNTKPYFAYDSGIRLNIVHNLFEVYFPVYSNNGWEVSKHAYPSRIRFILHLQPKRIVGFARRGFF